MSNNTISTITNYLKYSIPECVDQCGCYPNINEILDAIYDDLDLHITQTQLMSILKQLQFTHYFKQCVTRISQDKGDKQMTNNRYWLSAVVRDENYCTGSANVEKPWLLSMCESFISLEKAQEALATIKDRYEVLNAWVDCIDDNEKTTTVFFENYIDVLGYVAYKQEKRRGLEVQAMQWCDRHDCAFNFMEDMYKFRCYSKTEGFIHKDLRNL